MEKILSDLKAMRLPGMAQTWQNLMEAHKINSISMADGIRMLIQGPKISPMKREYSDQFIPK